VDSRLGLAVTGFDTSLLVTGSSSHSTLSFLCSSPSIISVQISARTVVFIQIPFEAEIPFSVTSLSASSLFLFVDALTNVGHRK